MTTRCCLRHRCELLEDGESCPHGHFCQEWLVIQHGVPVAEVRENGVTWLQPDGKLEDVLVPDPDLHGRRFIRGYENITRTEESRRRRRERDAAKREGREPAEWARKRSGPQFEEHDASFMRGSKYKAQRMRSEEAEA